MITSIKGKASPPAPLRMERGVNGGMPPMITSMKGKSLTPGPSPNGEGSEWRDTPDDNINEGTAGEKRKKFR
ncbi:hypothetical protein [Prevotella denticola]|uniref:hypothetical protein n=1 Tax=Prevotella denticola TaxID=28129 RepID=UPI0028E1C2C9|nr:hypothetical protein [Prevotella denticola]